MNQRDGNDDPAWLSAEEAARLLGVKRETLYAYASRGKIASAPVEGERTRRYARSDLQRIRARRDARSGHGAVAAGALRWGEPVLDSSLTRIDMDGHRYRGLSAIELARDGVRFECVAELLWSGELPGRAPRWEVAGFGAPSSRLAALLPSDARPPDAMALAIPALALADAGRLDSGRVRLRSRALVRRVVASLALPRGATAVNAAMEAGDTARSLLTALGAKAGTRAIAAVDRALVLCADHELNPSAFAARVAASTGADLYACVGAALATLSGPVHGGATERVDALLDEVDRPERAVSVVRARLRRGEVIAGFGHPLYPDGDPRARVLLADAQALGRRSRRQRTVRALVDAVSLAGGGEPNLDLGLAALCGALGLPAGAAHALFAAGRCVGWIAHAQEQRSAGFVLRPRARYVEPLL